MSFGGQKHLWLLTCFKMTNFIYFLFLDSMESNKDPYGIFTLLFLPLFFLHFSLSASHLCPSVPSFIPSTFLDNTHLKRKKIEVYFASFSCFRVGHVLCDLLIFPVYNLIWKGLQFIMAYETCHIYHRHNESNSWFNYDTITSITIWIKDLLFPDLLKRSSYLRTNSYKESFEWMLFFSFRNDPIHLLF